MTGIKNLAVSVVVDRHNAAEILTKVAVAGKAGCFPADVTCEKLGEALERICLNASGQNPLEQILTGWCNASVARKLRAQETAWSKLKPLPITSEF